MFATRKNVLFVCIFALIISAASMLVYSKMKPNVNNKIQNNAKISYQNWAHEYVKNAGTGMLRVVDPQRNNVTVSEGIGYGLLCSVAARDHNTFQGLWNYAKSHLNRNGLLAWNISSSGVVLGEGSASDADQDIAYALVLASRQWPNHGYSKDAKAMIQAICTHEISSRNVLLPGDSWGPNPPVNPSYIAPAYYPVFEAVTQNPRWNRILTTNLQILEDSMNASTGLLPDWTQPTRSSGSPASESNFSYDAIRVPIRLFQAYQLNNNAVAKRILTKEYETLNAIGSENLVAGYTLTGKPLVSYSNVPFQTAYAAVGQINPNSPFAKQTLNTLLKQSTESYFGDSLKTWFLFMLAGQLNA